LTSEDKKAIAKDRKKLEEVTSLLAKMNKILMIPSSEVNQEEYASKLKEEQDLHAKTKTMLDEAQKKAAAEKAQVEKLQKRIKGLLLDLLSHSLLFTSRDKNLVLRHPPCNYTEDVSGQGFCHGM
jgi:hypothetical protein